MLIDRISPQLRTQDLDQSIRFLHREGGPRAGLPLRGFLCGIRAGEQVFHLKFADGEDPSILDVSEGGHLHLYLGTQDVDAVASLLRRNGVDLLQEPTNTAWQTRELIFLDDQGHTIYVGQGREGADA